MFLVCLDASAGQPQPPRVVGGPDCFSQTSRFTGCCKPYDVTFCPSQRYASHLGQRRVPAEQWGLFGNVDLVVADMGNQSLVVLSVDEEGRDSAISTFDLQGLAARAVSVDSSGNIVCVAGDHLKVCVAGDQNLELVHDRLADLVVGHGNVAGLAIDPSGSGRLVVAGYGPDGKEGVFMLQ